MKHVLDLYKQYYAMPRELSDRAVFSHFVVLALFFFSLGFMLSQVIIFMFEN